MAAKNSINNSAALFGWVVFGVVVIGCDFWLFLSFKERIVGLVGDGLYRIISIGSIVILYYVFTNRCRKYFIKDKE